MGSELAFRTNVNKMVLSVKNPSFLRNASSDPGFNSSLTLVYKGGRVSHNRLMSDYNRLQWQCRRGMLELDTLLQGFLNDQYRVLPAKEQAIFEELLNYPDQLLFEYLMGKIKPTDVDIANVVERIRNPAAS